jgi:hypothetical protein
VANATETIGSSFCAAFSPRCHYLCLSTTVSD